MPAPPGYTSVYDQQKASFKNPLDTVFSPAPAAPTLQGGNIKDNLSTGPDLTSLTELVNTLNRNAQKQSNENRVPGSVGIESQLSKNTASLARGQLPQDVINQIQQQAAERGVSTGNNNFLRSLGLSSLNAQEMAQRNLSQATARNPGSPIFDPTSQLLTPYQKGNLDNQSALLSLDWFNALNRGVGLGGGRSGSGGGGSIMPDVTGTTAANNAWWNSLFPATTAPGVPSAGGGGSFGGTTTSIPGGSSYTYSGQDFGDLFDDPYANPAMTQPAGTVNTPDSSYYDPFGYYM